MPAKDFTDATGFSGTYFVKDTIWFDSPTSLTTKRADADWKDDKGNPYFTQQVKFHYVKEENDNPVNRLDMYFAESTNGPINWFKYDEQLFKKTGLMSFTNYSGSTKTAYTRIADGLVIKTTSNGDFSEELKVHQIYAKDKAQLSDFDNETCIALLQKKLNEGKLKEAEATKAKLMENEVYKQMKGKVGFVNHHGNTGSLYGKISEGMDVFISSVEIGKPVYYRAYYNDIPSLKYADCKKNTVFEIDGIKTSVYELRKRSTAWQDRMDKGRNTRPDNDFFSMCPTLINEYYSDYAVLYLLYQLKGKFAEGKSFKCKVTITNYRDGVDVEELATGTINLVYKEANKDKIQVLMDLIEKLEN